MSCTQEPVIESGDTGQLIPFLTAVNLLTITRMFLRISTIKLNTDCICLGHLASNAQLLQENSQSELAYFCSDIINTVEECIFTVHVLCGL